MSNAQLFVEAIHTANALAHAVFWGLVFAAALCVLVAPAVTAAVVWGVDALRDRLSGPVADEDATPVPEPHRPAKRRPVPAWAHTEPYTYDHAA